MNSQKGSGMAEVEVSAIKPRTVRLLRCSGTNRYFAEKGWTEDLGAARVFSDVMEAAEVCVRYGLVDVELVPRETNSKAQFAGIR